MPIALGFGTLTLAVYLSGKPGDRRVADKDATDVVRWIRSRSSAEQGLLLGVLAALVGFVGELAITEHILPALAGGPVPLAQAVVSVVIGAGLGLSVARHVTHRDYRCVQT